MADKFDTTLASSMAAEAVDLLPDGMKEAVSLALQAVVLNHSGNYKASEERIRKLRSVSYSREAYSYFLSARNEYALYESCDGENKEGLKHLAKARAALSQYLSSDIKARPEKEVIEAKLMKARADYILGHRKGIFM